MPRRLAGDGMSLARKTGRIQSFHEMWFSENISVQRFREFPGERKVISSFKSF
jgi:hypothetical protein